MVKGVNRTGKQLKKCGSEEFNSFMPRSGNIARERQHQTNSDINKPNDLVLRRSESTDEVTELPTCSTMCSTRIGKGLRHKIATEMKTNYTKLYYLSRRHVQKCFIEMLTTFIVIDTHFLEFLRFRSKLRNGILVIVQSVASAYQNIKSIHSLYVVDEVNPSFINIVIQHVVFFQNIFNVTSKSELSGLCLSEVSW